jgi:uncharacterized protein Yka (UPF0111/DUF47 family)
MSDSTRSNTDALPETAISLAEALEQLREGVETRREENSVIHDILAVASAFDVDTEPFRHPKITQSIFRYEHEADLVRGEIERGVETYDFDAKPEAIVTILKQAAVEDSWPPDEPEPAEV